MRYIYARVSAEDQNVKQQADYLADKYEHDSVVQEKFTGTTTDRPKFQNLLKNLTVVMLSLFTMFQDFEEKRQKS
tara:strand:- start:2097 stop:2321 length:225 start_codon:yes stop_codon:yes gene_type:complete